MTMGSEKDSRWKTGSLTEKATGSHWDSETHSDLMY